jgi:hypothetical protein
MAPAPAMQMRRGEELMMTPDERKKVEAVVSNMT